MMIITCDRIALSEACTAVQRAVSSKSTLPALEGVLLTALDGFLTLSGYDLEIGITTKIKADIKREGSIIINAKLFSDMMRRLPGETVSLQTDDKMMTMIKSEETEFSVMSFSADEYPDLPVIDDAKDISISADLLKSMITQTIFAVSQNDFKPVQTGVLFDIDEENIRLVAVDLYRLAMRTEKIKGYEKISFVVPGKTLSEINKLIGDKTEDVKIRVGMRHIIFETDEYHIISRLLDGEFLDYKNAMPKEESTAVIVSTRKLIDCMERLSLIITEMDRSPVRCIFDDNQIKASCVSAFGRGVDNVSANISGERVEIGFNNRYLLDALRATGCDEIKLSLSGAVAPMKILPTQGESFVFLVMPVRLKNDQ